MILYDRDYYFKNMIPGYQEAKDPNKTCDQCSYQEGRHYCSLYSEEARNMNIHACPHWCFTGSNSVDEYSMLVARGLLNQLRKHDREKLEAQARRIAEQDDRISWLEQQREEECKQKNAALKESDTCLNELREMHIQRVAEQHRIAFLEKTTLDMTQRCAEKIKATEAAEKRISELEEEIIKLSGWADMYMKAKAELEYLKAAGGPPFIRSEAIRNLKSDLDDCHRLRIVYLNVNLEKNNKIIELTALLATARDALAELKRNICEVILPNARTLTLDIGQLALWDLCIKDTDAALKATQPKEMT